MITSSNLMEAQELSLDLQAKLSSLLGAAVQVNFKVLQPTGGDRKERNKSVIQEVAVKVALFHGIDVIKLRKKTKKREIVMARWMCYKFLKSFYPLMPYKQIGAYFVTDHATVMYGIQTYNDLLQIYPAYAEEWNCFLQSIKPTRNELTDRDTAAPGVADSERSDTPFLEGQEGITRPQAGAVSRCAD